jgi:drug/metabolite transporter (DMT)-like permease
MLKSKVFWAYVAIMLGVLGHASSEFVAVLTGLFGPELSVWRFILGGSGLVLVALLYPPSRDLLTPLREQPLKIILLAFFGMALAQLIFHWSLNYATVIQVATLVTTMPIWVVIANYFINKAPIATPKIISGIGAFLGIVLLLTDGYLLQLTGGSADALLGVLMAIGCAAIGAVYMVMVKPLIQQYGAIRMTAYTFALGAVFLWIVVGLAWNIWVNPLTLFERAPDQYLSIMTMGWWNTTIAMVLWLGGLAAVPDMARANYLFFLKPVIAAILAYYILGDSVTVTQILAIIVVCSCVLMEVFWEPLQAFFAGRSKLAARS